MEELEQMKQRVWSRRSGEVKSGEVECLKQTNGVLLDKASALAVGLSKEKVGQ